MVYIDWYSPTGFDCIERVLEGVDTRVARVYFLGILVKQHMEISRISYTQSQKVAWEKVSRYSGIKTPFVKYFKTY